MSEDRPTVVFTSPEEFALLCDALGLALHGKNRVAMGESGFVAELAELIRNCGPALTRGLNDPAVRKAFGDGYSAGTLRPEERAAALLALIREGNGKDR